MLNKYHQLRADCIGCKFVTTSRTFDLGRCGRRGGSATHQSRNEQRRHNKIENGFHGFLRLDGSARPSWRVTSHLFMFIVWRLGRVTQSGQSDFYNIFTVADCSYRCMQRCQSNVYHQRQTSTRTGITYDNKEGIPRTAGRTGGPGSETPKPPQWSGLSACCGWSGREDLRPSAPDVSFAPLQLALCVPSCRLH